MAKHFRGHWLSMLNHGWSTIKHIKQGFIWEEATVLGASDDSKLPVFAKSSQSVTNREALMTGIHLQLLISLVACYLSGMIHGRFAHHHVSTFNLPGQRRSPEFCPLLVTELRTQLWRAPVDVPQQVVKASQVVKN